jgi:hypothetical protein
MATYYGTYGQKVQYLASDPSDPQIGQVWYNSTSATLKVRSSTSAGTWSTGGNLPQGFNGSAAAGIQTAALSFGGTNPVAPGPIGPTANTNSYNGTSWSPVSAMNTARFYLYGTGTQTAALGFGGYTTGPSTATEEWNGSSWTTVNTMPTGNYDGAAAGTQTAAIGFGGFPSTTITFLYDGTNWTTGGNLNTGRYSLAGSGIQTAALAFGGSPGFINSTELWNGTSWTSNPTGLNTARRGLAGAGTQTSTVAFGGNVPAPSGPLVASVSATEIWNGSSWTNNPNGMGTARYNMGRAGTGTAALAITGANQPSNPTPYLTATEEYVGPGVAETKTVTVS